MTGNADYVKLKRGIPLGEAVAVFAAVVAYRGSIDPDGMAPMANDLLDLLDELADAITRLREVVQ